MRKYATLSRRSILLLLAMFCFTFLWFAPPPAYAATAQVLVTQIQNISDSLVVELSPADPNVVEVSGSAAITSTVLLNIDRNVTVNWAADIDGGTASGRYLLNLSGGGTFNLTGGANIRNKSGIFSVTGAGANINVNHASLITPLQEDGGNGISINITADNVSLYVNAGGSILNEGSNSAINVSSGVIGVSININGGSVVSAPAGYAINDGGTSLCVNDTRITVNDGEVHSGSACAIKSTGMDSVLTVMGGIVTNEATVNSNPVIYMNGGLGENVTVGGTARVVASDNGLGYGIQTTGNLRIKDEAQVVATTGRAVNLVGMDSVATVDGGLVKASSGTAISTATTNPDTVEKASIIINGGKVYTDGGPHNSARAIYATGAKNTVEINGGWVYSSGLTEAIYVSGIESTVTVNGGWVSATDHFAIEAYNGGTVTINGGFVFAYGDEPLIDKTGAKIDNSAVGAIDYDKIHVNDGVDGNGVIVTWDRKAWAAAPWNEADYTEGYANHLKVYPGDLVDSYAPPEPLKAILPFGLIEGLTPLAIDDKGGETPVFPGFTDSPESIDESGQADSEETEASLDADAEEASPGEEKGLLSVFESGSPAGIIGADLPGLFPLAEPLNRVYWHDNGPRPNDGIYYNNMGNAGFFPLAEVEVTTTLVKYALYVTNGTGSGSYREGVVVSLLADTPSANKEFDYWRVLSGSGVAILDISASETTMIMPAGAVYIEAMYKDILYTLQVNGGSGSGSYPAGAIVPILANAPDSGREFDQWTSSGEGSFSNAYSSEASFQMPAADAAVTAQYRDIPLYTFTLQGGSIDGGYKGPYAAGTVITIRAPGMFPAGYAFNGWSIVSGGGALDNAFSSLARFTMPAADAVVSMNLPMYTGSATGHSLSVVDGFDRTGSGPYSAGVNINIEAAPAPEGKVFAGWSVVSGMGTIGNPDAVSTQFRMSDTDATVKANYINVEYPIFIEYGIILNEDNPYRFMAAGQFVMGEEISLKAIEPPQPPGTIRKYEFVGWTVSGGGSVADTASIETTLVMPADAVVVTAHWTPRYSFMVFSGEIQYPQADGGVLWGYYKAGEEIELQFAPGFTPTPPHVFAGWTSVSGGSFSDATQENTTFTMPDNDTFVVTGYLYTGTFHTLTVIGGKITAGGYDYGSSSPDIPSGAEVTITYDPTLLDPGTFDPVHDHFERWTSYSTEGTGNSNYGSFSAPAAVSTSFIMPAQNITVTAQVGRLFTLELDDNGDGVFSNEGLKAPGAQLPLIAVNRSTWPDDMAFTGWVANDGFFLNAGLMQTTFSMPAADAKVAATYVRNVHPLYSLNTINCSSDLPGPFTGDSLVIVYVTITADVPPGKTFSHWESTGISAPITSSPSFTFPMPDNNVTVTAVLSDIEYMLTVVNGEDDTVVGTSQHAAGASVPLTAPPPPTGKAFYQWESDNGGSFANMRASSTDFLMPVGDVTVTATYRVPQPVEEEPLPPSRPAAPSASSPVTSPAAGQAPGSVSHILRTDDHRFFVVGVGGRLFAPDKDMTRAETAAMFYNLLIRKDMEIARRFSDLPEGAWYKQAVDALASLGVVSGRPDGLYHPNDAITRAEFVAIAVRFTHESLEDRQAEAFTDVPETHWAYESIVTAASYGWIRGVGEGRFDPDRHISRAEVIAMTNRMLLRSPDKAYIDADQELITYTDVPKTHWAFYDIAEASNSHNFEKQEGSGEEKWLSLN